MSRLVLVDPKAHLLVPVVYVHVLQERDFGAGAHSSNTDK